MFIIDDKPYISGLCDLEKDFVDFQTNLLDYSANKLAQVQQVP